MTTTADALQLRASGITIEPAPGDPTHLGFQAIVLADPEGGEFCLVVKA